MFLIMPNLNLPRHGSCLMRLEPLRSYMQLRIGTLNMPAVAGGATRLQAAPSITRLRLMSWYKMRNAHLNAIHTIHVQQCTTARACGASTIDRWLLAA